MAGHGLHVVGLAHQSALTRAPHSPGTPRCRSTPMRNHRPWPPPRPDRSPRPGSGSRRPGCRCRCRRPTALGGSTTYSIQSGIGAHRPVLPYTTTSRSGSPPWLARWRRCPRWVACCGGCCRAWPPGEGDCAGHWSPGTCRSRCRRARAWPDARGHHGRSPPGAAIGRCTAWGPPPSRSGPPASRPARRIPAPGRGAHRGRGPRRAARPRRTARRRRDLLGGGVGSHEVWRMWRSMVHQEMSPGPKIRLPTVGRPVPPAPCAPGSPHDPAGPSRWRTRRLP